MSNSGACFSHHLLYSSEIHAENRVVTDHHLLAALQNCELPRRSSKLVREALIKGRLARTEASSFMSISALTAQPIV